MTIIEETSKVIYDGPYVIDDVLPIPFRYAEPEHVRIVLGADTELEYPFDYTITGQNATLLRNIPANVTVTVYRSTPLSNEAEFPQEGRFDSEKINDAIDKLTMQNQEQAEALSRTVKMAINIDGNSGVDISAMLSSLSPEATKCLKWNSQGSALVNSTYDPDSIYEQAEQRYLEVKVDADRADERAEDSETAATEAAKKAEEAAASAAEALRLVKLSAIYTMPDWGKHVKQDVRTVGGEPLVYTAEENGWLYIVGASNNPIFRLEIKEPNSEEWLPDFPVKTYTKTMSSNLCVPIPKGYSYRLNPYQDTKTLSVETVTVNKVNVLDDGYKNGLPLAGHTFMYFIPCLGEKLVPGAEFYTRDELDVMFTNYCTNAYLTANFYSKEQIDQLFASVPTNTYTKTEMDAFLAAKMSKPEFDAEVAATFQAIDEATAAVTNATTALQNFTSQIYDELALILGE